MSTLVLAANLLNEIEHLKWNDAPFIEKLVMEAAEFRDAGGVGDGLGPLGDLIDAGYELIVSRLLATSIGDAQLSHDTALRVESELSAMPLSGSSVARVERLLDPRWAVLYAAGWLGILSNGLRSDGLQVKDDYLLILYQGGTYEHNFYNAISAGQCPGCFPDGEVRLRDLNHYYSRGVTVIAQLAVYLE